MARVWWPTRPFLSPTSFISSCLQHRYIFWNHPITYQRQMIWKSLAMFELQQITHTMDLNIFQKTKTMIFISWYKEMDQCTIDTTQKKNTLIHEKSIWHFSTQEILEKLLIKFRILHRKPSLATDLVMIHTLWIISYD